MGISLLLVCFILVCKVLRGRGFSFFLVFLASVFRGRIYKVVVYDAV